MYMWNLYIWMQVPLETRRKYWIPWSCLTWVLGNKVQEQCVLLRAEPALQPPHTDWALFALCTDYAFHYPATPASYRSNQSSLIHAVAFETNSYLKCVTLQDQKTSLVAPYFMAWHIFLWEAFNKHLGLWPGSQMSFKCLYLYVCRTAPVWCGGQRTTCRSQWSAMGAFGIKLWLSGWAASTFTHWAFLLAPHVPFLLPAGWWCYSRGCGSLGGRGLPDGSSPIGQGFEGNGLAPTSCLVWHGLHGGSAHTPKARDCSTPEGLCCISSNSFCKEFCRTEAGRNAS